MDTKKITSVTPKKSFLQKIAAFVRNDVDYQPETPKAPIHISSGSAKALSSWKNIKAALFVLVTFYILLCAFILLNPQFALFFNNVFAIEYVTIQRVLEYTIYVFYSIFGIILGTAFLFFWYRAIVIKTRKRFKHTSLWILTVVFGGLFFGNIALFAFSYNWFLGIDFSNLEERVIIYDNTLLGYKPKMKDTLLRYNPKMKTNDLTFFKIPKKGIGPVSVRYDISPQIKKAVRTNGLLLSRGYSFSIDYNKDGEPDTGSGENTKIDFPITHPDAPLLVPGRFDEVGQYKTTATLIATDAGGNKKEIAIEIPDVLIQNIVQVSYKDGKDGSKIYLFDASDLSALGQAQWSIIGSTDSEVNGYQFSPENITDYPAVICLKMQPMDVASTDPCDWRYIIGESIQTNITNTNIQTKIDPVNPLKYQFSLDPQLAQGQIKTIRWRIDGRLYDSTFPSGTERILDYTFKKSGTYSVEAEIEDTLGNTVNSAKETIFTTLFTTLKSGYTLQIVDENGLDVAKHTYDDILKTYLLPDMAVPSILTFDAIGIQSINSRLKLVQVEWDMDNDGIYEKKGFQTSYDLQLPIQYTFFARYTFEDVTIDGEIQKQMYVDKIVVKGEQKSLDVRVKIRPDHEYAPALVHFDATGSKTQKGTLQKFFYEFGNGKTYEGEAIVDYRYTTPGEYRVRVTAVTNLGEKATKEYILIIKKPQEIIKIEPSISAENSAVDTPITFVAVTQGAVKKIIWNFGDNAPSPDGESVIHTFATPGTYTITARAFYESGIEKTDTIFYTIR